MKRLLFLAHRWLGIALCLVLLLWFGSGLVMMYVGYPKLTTAERLAALPPLDPQRCCASLEDLLAAARAGNASASGVAGAPSSVRLTTVAGAPRAVLGFGKAAPVAVEAAKGAVAPIDPVDEAAALSAARAYRPGAGVVSEGAVAEDAWTHSRALDPHRPLWRVRADDAEGTVVWVSSRTGEPVRDATATERAWNWVGAWLHWLYVFRGGAVDRHWHDIVVWLSVAGTALVVTGTAAGWLRVRWRRPYRNGTASPYPPGVARWHHWLGLGAGALAFTWVMSGLFSMNPWRLFDSGAPPLDEAAFHGGALEPGRFAFGPAEALARLRAAGFTARELELRVFDGTGLYVGFDGGGGTRVLPAVPEGAALERLPRAAVEAAAARLLPGSRVASAQWLEGFDAYWYGRAEHTMLGHVEKRLPVLRVRFADAHDTWVHVDPHTGAVAGRLDRHQRVKRWAFAFLHSWDWLPLLENRPAWDVLLVAGSLCGLGLAGTGTVAAWRRVARKGRARA